MSLRALPLTTTIDHGIACSDDDAKAGLVSSDRAFVYSSKGLVESN